MDLFKCLDLLTEADKKEEEKNGKTKPSKTLKPLPKSTEDGGIDWETAVKGGVENIPAKLLGRSGITHRGVTSGLGALTTPSGRHERHTEEGEEHGREAPLKSLKQTAGRRTSPEAVVKARKRVKTAKAELSGSAHKDEK